jgi:cytochrome P450 family 130
MTSLSQARFAPRSGESWRDVWSMYESLRDHDPVHYVERGDYWVLSRYDDVWAAARDFERFSSADGLTFAYDDRAQAGIDQIRPMVMLDPPDHTAFRRLVGRGFTPRRVTEIEPEVRAYVVELIERLRSEGSGDIAASLFKPVPSMVVGLYLGVPAADRKRFDEWTDSIVAANAHGDPLHAAKAVGELFGYFSDLMELRREQPQDDLISQLVACAGDDVTDLEILGFAFTMVTGGNDTTTGLLGGTAELLTSHRDQRGRLIADPGLIPEAVEEFLRLTSPVQGLARTTTEEVAVGDVTIPAGKKVMLLYASANRDPRRWGDDADQLDIYRNPRQILTFGYGPHHCLGAAAARLQARVVLEELLARCPDFSVDASAGTFAPGAFIRRFETLPFEAGRPA